MREYQRPLTPYEQVLAGRRATRIHHHNDLSRGSCHYYTSAKTGDRLLFREEEIEKITFNPAGGAFVHVKGGAQFGVLDAEPDEVR